MGARVTGIDVNAEGIEVAEAHAAQDARLTGLLQYRACSTADLLVEGGWQGARQDQQFSPHQQQHQGQRGREYQQQEEEDGGPFDAVIASEVIEHVSSVQRFCEELGALTRPGGAVVVSTMNRTPRAFALAVVAAEYVLRWVPMGEYAGHLGRAGV
jgi:2-polyprenyl-3-methyl-5-hydroxy-6-metoxy-1,4-benzoquinol methylase